MLDYVHPKNNKGVMLNLFQHLKRMAGQKLLRDSLLKILKQVQDDTVGRLVRELNSPALQGVWG